MKILYLINGIESAKFNNTQNEIYKQSCESLAMDGNDALLPRMLL